MEVTFETYEDPQNRCYVIRGRLGDRCVEESLAWSQLDHGPYTRLIGIFDRIKESIRRRLLEDQRMQCKFNIYIVDGSDFVLMRASKLQPLRYNEGHVEETFTGPITPGSIENMKCVLRNRLEERERQTQQRPVGDTYQNIWGGPIYPADWRAYNEQVAERPEPMRHPEMTYRPASWGNPGSFSAAAQRIEDREAEGAYEA